METTEHKPTLAENAYLRGTIEDIKARREQFEWLSTGAIKILENLGEDQFVVSESMYGNAVKYLGEVVDGWRLIIARPPRTYKDKVIWFELANINDEQAGNVRFATIDLDNEQILDKNGNHMPLDEIRKLTNLTEQIAEIEHLE